MLFKSFLELENYAEPAVAHSTQSFTRIQVLGQQRSWRDRLVRIG